MSLRQVFVMNGGSFQDQAFTDPAAVTAGTIAAFGVDGTLLQIADGADGDTLQDLLAAQDAFIVLGNDDLILRTTEITKANLHSVLKREFVAPTPQVTTISDIPTGTEGYASIKVVDLTEGYEQFPRKTYEIHIGAADTAAQIVTKFVNRINSGTGAKQAVTASASGNNLVLTAKEVGTNFTVATDLLFSSVTITGTTAPDTGSGTYEQIRDIEIANRGFMYGDYYVNDGILGSPEALPVFAQAGKEYDVYVIRIKNNIDESVDAANRFHEIVLAVATTGVTGSLDTFLGL